LLAAELCLAAPAFARDKEQCMKNCDKVVKEVEDLCKERGTNGKCDGRMKEGVKAAQKACQDDCNSTGRSSKRRNSSPPPQ
jgi:hypothetical protein